MDLGMIGLGRMGADMTERLRRGGHPVAGFDGSAEARGRSIDRGLQVFSSLADLAGHLRPPRVFWLMVPAGDAVDEVIDALAPFLAAGDIVVDGGNSFYRDSQRRARRLASAGVAYVDCGTSGGVRGLEHGYCLMLGGEAGTVERLSPLLATLAPAPDRGWGRVGASGAGHFTKMVHNGIEYGLMQAYGEGFALLQRKREFTLDLHQVAEIWRHGSVVRSWLLDLAAAALEGNPALDGIAPYVADSGFGRATVREAIDLDVAAPVITLALLQRLHSRDPDSFSDKLLAALRHEFGGHAIRKE